MKHTFLELCSDCYSSHQQTWLAYHLCAREIGLENILLLSSTHNVTIRFFAWSYFYLFNMCLYVFVCDYLSLGVISWVFVLEGYFGLLVSKGNLVIP